MKVVGFVKDTLKELTEIIGREADFHAARPKKALWFLTYRCTSKCNTCTMWKRPRENKPEVSLAECMQISDKLVNSGVTSVEIFGGDVLLRKDVLFPLIKYLKEKNIVIYMPTNCNLLDEQTAKALVDLQIDKLYLSTDGVEEGHDAVRGVPGTFERIKNAIDFLKEARGERKRPSFVCNATISSLNVHMIDKIIEFAKQKNFDEMHFEYVGEVDDKHIDNSIIDGLRPTPYYIKQGSSVLLNQEQAIYLKHKIKELKTIKINGLFLKTLNIDMFSIDDLVQGTVVGKKCYVERNEVTINPYGDIVACPFVNNYMLGNILRDDLSDIWNNDLHRKFRCFQNQGKIELCRHCILSIQRNYNMFGGLRRIYIQRFSDNLFKLVNRKKN